MTMNAEARRASYQRAVDDARQTVENWLLNTESLYDRVRALARRADIADSAKCVLLRGYVYLFIAGGIVGARGMMDGVMLAVAKFTSADYDARRAQIDAWYGATLEKTQTYVRIAPQSRVALTYEDACGMARDLAMTGVWLADDNEQLSALTVYDALTLALDAADWQWLIDYLRED